MVKNSIVNRQDALACVLAGGEVQPHYYGPALYVGYEKGKGLVWRGVNANQAMGAPERFWNALTEGPDDERWRIVTPAPDPKQVPLPFLGDKKPQTQSRRGQWFDGRKGRFVPIRSMSDEHVDNALSYLAIKEAELKAEKERRAVPPEKTGNNAEALVHLLAGGKITRTSANFGSERGYFRMVRNPKSGKSEFVHVYLGETCVSEYLLANALTNSHGLWFLL